MTALPSNFWRDSNGNVVEAPVHTSPANDVLAAPLCAGRGQYHTDKREQLDTITLQKIRQMIETGRDGLQTSDKHAGLWFIPSDQLTRSHEQHRNQGRYHALWFDADELQGRTMADSIEHAAGHIPGDFWAYASRSATEDNQKHRLIIPLLEPVDGYTWQIMQAILNDLMQAGGIQPDIVNERSGQLCYLPNPGEWYSAHVEEMLGFLSPHQWADQIAAIKAADAAAKAEADAKREDSRLRAAELVKVQGVLPRTAYAEQVRSWDAWITYGAKPRGKRLLSPYSSSGSAAISIMESGKWVSHHGSDQAAGIGAPFPGGSGQWGDSFDLYCHFEHGGDEAAAVEAVANQLDPQGQKQRQRDYMQQKAQDETLAELCSVADAIADEYQQAVPAEPSPFRFLDADQLADNAKAPAFIVDKVLETDAHGLCFGGSGSYKTFWALRMAFCIATGQDFMGRKVRRPGPVVFVCGEGAGGIGRRVKALKMRHGSASGNLIVVPVGVDLSNPQVMTLFGQALEDIKPRLVVFDTFAALNGGIDENSPTEVGQALRSVRLACRRAGASSMIVHHSGKDETRGARGAGNFYNDMDFVYAIKRSKSEAMGIEINTHVDQGGKMKDGEPFLMFCHAEVQDLGIADEDGVKVTSLVIEETNSAAAGFQNIEHGENLTQKEKALLCLGDLYRRQCDQLEEGGYSSPRPAVTRRDWIDELKRLGMSNPSQVIKRLVEQEPDKIEALAGDQFRPVC